MGKVLGMGRAWEWAGKVRGWWACKESYENRRGVGKVLGVGRAWEWKVRGVGHRKFEGMRGG